MKLQQIDPLSLKSPTPLGDVRSNDFSSYRHRMENAVFRCGEDVLPERIRCEELALRKSNVSLRRKNRGEGFTNSQDFGVPIVVRHVESSEAARNM